MVEYDAHPHLLTKLKRYRIAPNQKIGVFLSGGLDSSVVTYVARTVGADTTALHFSGAGCSPADERNFVDKLCQDLEIARVDIPAATSAQQSRNCLELNWRFPLSYQPGFHRWFDCAAEAAVQRGITTLTGGHYSDHIFGDNLPFIDLRGLFQNIPLLTAYTYMKELFGVPEELMRLFKSVKNGKAKDNSAALFSPFNSITKSFFTKRARDAARDHGRYKPHADISDINLHLQYLNIKKAFEHEQEATLDLAVMVPRGIQFFHFFADRSLLNFGLGLPVGYKVLPYGGEWYQKPVLRLAFLGMLPPKIIRRYFYPFWHAVFAEYCFKNRQVLQQLLGNNAILTQLQIIDPKKITNILANSSKLEETSNMLLSTATVELWLQSLTNGV